MNSSLSACFAILAQALSQCAVLNPADAATVMPIWQNDTAANTLTFNDTFGHQVNIGTYNPTTGAWMISPGSGVTSLTWTGGLVSIANPTTTPAFTVAGTSGGIPYFSSGTTWASSAALGANQIVLGGGAGAAPATLGSLGTSTTLLHGNVSGAPAFSAVTSADLTAAFASPPPLGNITPNAGTFNAFTLSADTNYADIVLSNTGVAFYAQVFDVTAFGVVGDGTTVNNTANTNALTAAVVSGGQVRYPCGTFKITNAQAITIANNTNLTIKGGGQGCTKIAFSGASATGFTFTYGNQFSSLNVQDLTITTDQAGATSGAAIHLLSTAANANPALSPATIIENVTIIGSDLYTNSNYANYWLKSIWVDDVSSVLIAHSTFVGPKTFGGKMVTMNGNSGSTTYATATTLLGDIFVACGQCIQIGSYYQGLSISGGNFTGGVNAIEVPASLTGSLDEMVITTSQFGFFTGVGIIDINTLYQDVNIVANEFNVGINSSAINGTMSFYSIAANTIFATTSTGTTGIHLTYGGGSGSASGNNLGTIGGSNTLFDLVTGISIDANNHATLGRNTFGNNTTNILNNSTTTVWTDFGDIAAQSPAAGYVGEVISCNVAVGSPVSLTSGQAKTVCSVSLTPGDWSCEGDVADAPAAGTTTSFFVGSISPTNNGLDTTPGYVSLPFSAPASSATASPTGQRIIKLTTTTPEYLVIFVNFAASTMGGYGNMSCTRFM